MSNGLPRIFLRQMRGCSRKGRLRSLRRGTAFPPTGSRTPVCGRIPPCQAHRRTRSRRRGESRISSWNSQKALGQRKQAVRNGLGVMRMKAYGYLPFSAEANGKCIRPAFEVELSRSGGEGVFAESGRIQREMHSVRHADGTFDGSADGRLLGVGQEEHVVSGMSESKEPVFRETRLPKHLLFEVAVRENDIDSLHLLVSSANLAGCGVKALYAERTVPGVEIELSFSLLRHAVEEKSLRIVDPYARRGGLAIRLKRPHAYRAPGLDMPAAFAVFGRPKQPDDV